MRNGQVYRRNRQDWKHQSDPVQADNITDDEHFDGIPPDEKDDVNQGDKKEGQESESTLLQ